MKNVYHRGKIFIKVSEAWLAEHVKHINHVTHVNYVDTPFLKYFAYERMFEVRFVLLFI